MTIPTSVQNLLNAGRVAVRGGVRVQLGSGIYGFWNGTGEISIDGLVYKPNSLINVEEPPQGMGMEALPLRIELPESADFGITPDILAQIEDEDYKGRPVIIYDFYFEPDSRNFLHAEPLYAGFIDYIDHVRDGEGMKLVGHIETKALDNHRDGYRSASNADQQLVSAGDRFFEHAATVNTETFLITLD